MFIYIYVYTHLSQYIYIYIYIEREREDSLRVAAPLSGSAPPRRGSPTARRAACYYY